MKGVLLLNGEPYEGEMEKKDSFVCCCDGAYAWAKGKIEIDENVGDFDSLSAIPYPLPEKVYPSEKDCTDGEIGLSSLIRRGCKEIAIYGGGGGREDHFLGNLHLLYAASLHGVKAEMITNNSRMFIASGRVELLNEKGKTVSLLPFGENAHIVKGEGFYYPLCDLTLRYGSCRTISNVVTENRAWAECDRGKILVVLQREKNN